MYCQNDIDPLHEMTKSYNLNVKKIRELMEKLHSNVCCKLQVNYFNIFLIFHLPPHVQNGMACGAFHYRHFFQIGTKRIAFQTGIGFLFYHPFPENFHYLHMVIHNNRPYVSQTWKEIPAYLLRFFCRIETMLPVFQTGKVNLFS